jgi:drug/metabolite transporter (DMT)-like permease
MKSRSVFQYVLGGLIVMGFFVLLFLLVINDVPETNKDLLNITVGALIGSFSTVVGYFYGSSAGSATKTELLHKPNESDPVKV